MGALPEAEPVAADLPRIAGEGPAAVSRAFAMAPMPGAGYVDVWGSRRDFGAHITGEKPGESQGHKPGAHFLC
jgi:hypothetical protein